MMVHSGHRLRICMQRGKRSRWQDAPARIAKIAGMKPGPTASERMLPAHARGPTFATQVRFVCASATARGWSTRPTYIIAAGASLWRDDEQCRNGKAKTRPTK
eukprot:377976-Prymnesium_polylepis.4